MTCLTTNAPSSPTTPSRTRKRRSVRNSFSRLRSSEESSSSLPSLYTDTTSSSALHRSCSGRSSHVSQHHKVYSPSSPRPDFPQSPITTGRRGRKSSSRLSVGSVVSIAPSSNGIGDTTLGNLADELDGQYSYGDQEQEEAGYDVTEDILLKLQEGESDTSMLAAYGPVSLHQYRYTTPIQSPTKSCFSERNSVQRPASISPSKQWSSFSLRKPKPESLYDGSDYGPSSAEENTSEPTATPILQRRIHDLEEITRISGTTDSVLDAEDVIGRTTRRLKEELGDQSVVESGSSRLATGYISMSTHRTHQSREIQTLAHKLIAVSGYSNHAYPYGSLLDLPSDLLETITTEIDLLTNYLPVQTALSPN